MKRKVFTLMIVLTSITAIHAQTHTDSLAKEARSYVARNFSTARTFNLYWEPSLAHNYTLMQHGNELENGRFKEIQTVKFSATIPVMLLKKFSLYANGNFNFYQFETSNNVRGDQSAAFSENEDGYHFYEGSITGTYRTKLGSKHLILIASGFADGWGRGFEKASGMFSAILVLKQSRTTSFSAGLLGMTLYDKIPVLPIVAYWHQFTPRLSLDITLPRNAYLRYQIKNQRLSLGASMGNDHFYMKPGNANLSEVSFFNRSTINPELVYEYIINKHFYLIARGGGSALISGGIYGTNRKSADGNPYMRLKQPMTTFFNFGFSYNIFE